MKNLALPFGLFIFFTLLAQALIQFGVIPSFLVPAPSAVLQALIEQKAEFTKRFVFHRHQFFDRTFAGVLSGLRPGSDFFPESNFAPHDFSLRRFFQTVPIIAIAPLLVIWFGFGSPTIQAASAMVSFFPLLANILVGLQSSTKEQDELFQIYHATKWQRLYLLQIPCSVWQIFVGLKVASGLAIIGAIVGEFIAGGGLGGLIDAARTQQRVDLIFAAILLSSFLGLVYIGAVGSLEKIWRTKLRQTKFF